MQMSKEDLKIFVENASDLATYSTLTYLYTFLDQIFKLEIDENNGQKRKLTVEEMLEALRDFLKSLTDEMLQKIKMEETKKESSSND